MYVYVFICIYSYVVMLYEVMLPFRHDMWFNRVIVLFSCVWKTLV